MEIPRDEIKCAEIAIKSILSTSTSAKDLSRLVSLLSPQGHSEDAIRTAFWFLVGDGKLSLGKDFAATLTP